MREGIHRDGRHLYPAFPYTHFARTSDADLQALYAYLMAQPAVSAPNRATTLAFPFNLRPLLAGWNMLFHSTATVAADPARSDAWNRGAYLVEGLGHCGACHTPRNALGAERSRAKFAGGFADGWEAPPLSSVSHAPIPWSEDELFAYLRGGASRYHGTAAGPMAAVVRELAGVPDSDVRAMAVYLASFNTPTTPAAQETLAARLETITAASALAGDTIGARIYQGACAVCHQVGGPALFGSRPSLALNSNLHSAVPDNLIQVILHGIAEPAARDLGIMPAFGGSLNDAQIAHLVSFLRRQFAPDKPAWTDLAATVSRLRHVHGG
jgi:nicotinate dehydrogenase subunit B